MRIRPGRAHMLAYPTKMETRNRANEGVVIRPIGPNEVISALDVTADAWVASGWLKALVADDATRSAAVTGHLRPTVDRWRDIAQQQAQSVRQQYHRLIGAWTCRGLSAVAELEEATSSASIIPVSLKRRIQPAYANVRSIATAPTEQGKGNASILLAYGMELFDPEQIPTAYVLSANQVALDFFTRCGLADTGAVENADVRLGEVSLPGVHLQRLAGGQSEDGTQIINASSFRDRLLLPEGS